MDWYYEKQGEQFGPISEVELKGLYGRGELTAQNLVWRETMTDWATYGSVFASEGVVVQAQPRSQRTKRGNSCRELRAEGRDGLSGNWMIAVLVIFLMQVVMQASSMAAIIPLIGLLVPIFIAGPLTVGMYAYFLGLIRGEAVEVGTLFSGFSKLFKYTGLFLLVTLIVVVAAMIGAIPGGVLVGLVVSKNPQAFEQNPDLAFEDPLFVLGFALLMILPLLAATYFWFRYILVYFIAVDEPDMKVVDILGRSSELMKKQMWKFSWLLLSYTGWFILGMLAFFIGILWSSAYWMAGFAAFYDDRREQFAA